MTGLKKLPDGAKDTINHLAETFKTHYIQPPVLMFKSACEVFGKRQADDQSIDAYVSRLRSLYLYVGSYRIPGVGVGCHVAFLRIYCTINPICRSLVASLGDIDKLNGRSRRSVG